MRHVAYHVPGLHPDLDRQMLQISGTDQQVPVLDSQDASCVWNELQAGAQQWRRLSLTQRIEHLSALAHTLRMRGPGDWTEALVRSTGLSAAGLAAAWDVTFASCDTATLRSCLAVEGLADDGVWKMLERDGRLPRRMVHVLAGNVLPPTWHMLVRGWILGGAQWMRPATGEPVLAACLAAALRKFSPELAACTAVLWWPHDATTTEAAVLATTDVLTLQGDDASVVTVRDKARRLCPDARFVGFGSRWSADVVARGAQDEAAARAVARDVVLFDQRGCLSPTLVFAQAGEHLEKWCELLAQGFEGLERKIPVGRLDAPMRAALRHWRELRRLQMARREVQRLWEGSDGGWCVALGKTCELFDSPRYRHVVVVPFQQLADVAKVIKLQQDSLQGLAVDWCGGNPQELQALLDEVKPPRVARIGQIQNVPPIWSQDNQPALRSLLR